MDGFGHDPTDSTTIDPSTLTSLDEAKRHLDEGEGDGLGFVMTRHDPFLVAELTNCLDGDGNLAKPIEQIIDNLGWTFAEKDTAPEIRLIYRGQLPDHLHGGEPVVINVSVGDRQITFRFFDSGWTPVTGDHVADTPKDCEDIDDGALRTVLEKGGAI